MRKPYWKEQQVAEDRRKQEEADSEIKEFLKDPFKDPFQELVDNLANSVDQRKKQEQERARNATLAAAKKGLD